jgi:hypothetical protein
VEARRPRFLFRLPRCRLERASHASRRGDRRPRRRRPRRQALPILSRPRGRARYRPELQAAGPSLAAIWRLCPPVSFVSGLWPAPLSSPDLCRVVGHDRRADERGPESCSCCRLSATLDETLFSACREMLCLQAVICHHSWGRRRRIRHGQVAGAAHTRCSTWRCPGRPFTLQLPSAAPAGEERGPGTGVSARGGPVFCSFLGSAVGSVLFWFCLGCTLIVNYVCFWRLSGITVEKYSRLLLRHFVLACKCMT